MESSTLKKAVLIGGLVVLAPVLLVSFVALASGEWRSVGQTEAGDKVSVSLVHSLKHNQRVALVRVQFKDPIQLQPGGPFLEMRTRVRIDCASRIATPSTEWFYTRDRTGRYVVSKKSNQDNQLGKDQEGGFAELVSNSLCGSGK